MVVQRVASAIRRDSIFTPGEHIVVAVSGGPDSLALLAILRALAPTFSLSLSVAHFDHGWRTDSTQDARFVASVAEGYGYSVTIGQAEPGRPHTEEAARSDRYQFLRATAQAQRCTAIALGHTQDDQVETLLLHLLRGSGLHGLGGMRPRAGDLARPLLTVTRVDIEEFLKSVQLIPRIDTSNADPRHARNRLRQLVLPVLERFQPAARSLLARTAEIVAGEDALLEQEVDRAFRPDLLSDRAGFRAHPIGLQRRLLRRLLPDLDYDHVEALRELIASTGVGQSLSLPGGRLAVATAGAIEIQPTGGPEAAATQAESQRLVVRRCDCDPSTYKARDRVAHVDAARIRMPLRLTRRVPGDRLQPLGFGHTKKLQDVLVDAHVPRSRRSQLAIVRDQDGIVWVPGVTVAENKRATADTIERLHLEIASE